MGERTAIVTGAARGIGRAIAMELARQGNYVFITDISDNGVTAQEEINALGYKAKFMRVDVSDHDDVNSCVEKIYRDSGDVSIMVNNAGIRPTCPFGEMTPEEWHHIHQVNLDSVFYFCRAVFPIMQKNRWGRIINMSSLAAQQGSTGGHSHYASSKSGLVGLSKSLARELGPYHVTVNVVSPGWIDTEGWGGELDGKRDIYAAKVTLGRLGRPEDVAYAVAFLASDQAEYITGVTLPVNGGLYIS